MSEEGKYLVVIRQSQERNCFVHALGPGDALTIVCEQINNGTFPDFETLEYRHGTIELEPVFAEWMEP